MVAQILNSGVLVMRLLFLLSIVALACGCSPRYSDFYPYYDNGTKKPSLVFLPVINDTKSPLATDMPIDLTKAIRNRIKRQGKMYIPPSDKMQNVLRNISLKEFAEPNSLKQFQHFDGVDFVVSTDLVDCQVVPYKRGEFKPLYVSHLKAHDAKVMMLAVRLKIVQLVTGKEPKVVRQELVQSNHMVSDEDVKLALKGDKNALEIVRSRLARDLASKIEETICVKR
jgi:hypothetical protein